MAWSTPLTAVASSALTAAQWNASVRDNLLQTAVAKVTTAGSHFVATGSHTLAQRTIVDDIVETTGSSSSTSYINLSSVGPYVNATTGVKALTWMNCSMSNSVMAGGTYASLEIYGDTTLAPSDARGLYLQNDIGHDVRAGVCTLNDTTPGSNTFRMQYRVAAGTGTWLRRRIIVMPL
jgi:hypothetical protein